MSFGIYGKNVVKKGIQTMKKALIFYGGWEGHTPRETADVFESWLTDEGYHVIKTDGMDILNNYENIKDILY